MSSQQQYDICFPWNTSPAADAPWDATAFTAPQHPRSVPSSYPPVPGQLRGHAGVVRDAVVSDRLHGVPPFTRTHVPVFSSYRRMLLAIIGQTTTGLICPHPSITPPPKVNHKTCGTLTWAITIWLMITLSIVIMLLTMQRLLSMSAPTYRLPHLIPYVLTSLFRIHISNQTFRWRRLTYSTTQLGTLRLMLLEPSPTNVLTGALSPIGRPMRSFESSQCSTCASPIHELL
jgi:hypothetical protein